MVHEQVDHKIDECYQQNLEEKPNPFFMQMMAYTTQAKINLKLHHIDKLCSSLFYHYGDQS